MLRSTAFGMNCVHHCLNGLRAITLCWMANADISRTLTSSASVIGEAGPSSIVLGDAKAGNEADRVDERDEENGVARNSVEDARKRPSALPGNRPVQRREWCWRSSLVLLNMALKDEMRARHNINWVDRLKSRRSVDRPNFSGAPP